MCLREFQSRQAGCSDGEALLWSLIKNCELYIHHALVSGSLKGPRLLLRSLLHPPPPHLCPSLAKIPCCHEGRSNLLSPKPLKGNGVSGTRRDQGEHCLLVILWVHHPAIIIAVTLCYYLMNLKCHLGCTEQQSFELQEHQQVFGLTFIVL